MNIRSVLLKKFVLQAILAAILLFFALYTDYITNLSTLSQVLIVTFFAAVSVISSNFNNFSDYINEIRKNSRLLMDNKTLKAADSKRSKQLDGLKKVMVSFMEHSHIYREKIKNRLKLNEDFVFITKSSEGLSEIFNELEEKRPLPFTKVLMDIPGSIRPFERMGMFLIPVRSMPGVRKQSLRSYIDTKIIPKVVSERKKFLSTLPKSTAQKADNLSFKYIAFFVSRDNIAQDAINRKFNKNFNTFIVNEQIGDDFIVMKSELVKVVKTKELLQLVDWKTFADLNKEQNKLIEYYKEKINISFTKSEVDGLNALSKLNYQELQNLLWPIMRRKTTKRKVFNLSKNIIDGSRSTIQTLKENGVNF